MNTKRALIDAAEQACRQFGYDGFSYADLSTVVGIRKASIHHHFPTKADLAVALIESYSDDFFAALDTIARRQAQAAARLRAYLARYRLALDGGERVCLCVAMSLGRDRLNDDALNALAAFHARSHDWLRAAFVLALEDGTVRDVGDAVVESRACLALVEGAQLIARALRDPTAFDDATHRFALRLGAD